MKLFRNGGFATVDEFSKLASEHNLKQAQDMKRLMRVALTFHNPEDNFHESDYYPFIQRLFREDELHSLRPNITILSYNYDCYLDFLLLRAFKHRFEIANADARIDWHQANRMTSGFYEPSNQEWADQTANFNFLKLHGSIAYGEGASNEHDSMFVARTAERLQRYVNSSYKSAVPPIVFPWELFDDSENIIPEEGFVFVKDIKDDALKRQGKLLYQLYSKIWKGARQAVSRASKISFVGLSAHEYMEPGWKFLFKDKTGVVQVVVANTENSQFKDFKERLHPASLCGRIGNILNRIAPNLKYVRSRSEDNGTFTIEEFENAKEGRYEPDITPRYSFKDFIRTEMQ